jgi:hypothetical protein
MPLEHGSGYGPRVTSVVGEMTGLVGASRSTVHDLCASLFGIPLSTGAIQKMVDRVSEATLPPYTAMGDVARTSRCTTLTRPRDSSTVIAIGCG